ncbi:hypothetical protein RAVI111496_06400 [Rahnella victoriana]
MSVVLCQRKNLTEIFANYYRELTPDIPFTGLF